MKDKKEPKVLYLHPKILPSLIVMDIEFIILSIIMTVFIIMLFAFFLSLFKTSTTIPIFFIISIGVYSTYSLLREYYKNSIYEIHSDRIKIKTKFVINREVTINYKNILDITKWQGPIQSQFNVSTIVLKLAGDHHKYRMNYLENAEEIIDLITERKKLA